MELHLSRAVEENMSERVAERLNIIPLASMSEGSRGYVHLIIGGYGARRRLIELGFTPGTEVVILRQMGYGPILVEVRGTRVAIGRGLASKILVRAVG